MRWILILTVVSFCGCSRSPCFDPVEALGDGSLGGFCLSDIEAAYESNAIRASSVYVGRRIKVLGSVKSVVSTVWLEGAGDVSLTFSDEEDMARLSKGQSIDCECVLHNAAPLDKLYLEFRGCTIN